MAEYTNFYQLALYYDIALQRDVTSQVKFFFDVHRKHTGRELRSLLDIACGPGYHAVGAAREGVRAVGLDLMPQMIDLARQRSDPSLHLEWVAADMRDYRLDEPVDMAICLFDGIDAMTNDDDMLRHLCCTAQNLNPGGLYIIQQVHPRDCSLQHYGGFHYEGERDDIHVSIEWAVNHPTFDLVRGVAEVEIELHVRDHGIEKVFHDHAEERLFTPQELRLFAQCSGVFDIVGWYGTFYIDQPFDNSPLSEYMIVVLKKKD